METAAAAGRPGRREHAVRERMVVPVRYALRRLRVNWPRTLIVALGIAVGAAVLAMTAVGSAAVQDRAVQRALAQLVPSLHHGMSATDQCCHVFGPDDRA